MDRRAFLSALGTGWLVQTAGEHPPRIAGQVVGASHAAGHLLRGGAPVVSSAVVRAVVQEKADVVIVGGGVSGLSAAWRLAPAGLDVAVLELEPRPGGTSTWGEEGAVPHPWGAHYLAAPNVEARAALRLLQEMGAVTGWDAAGRPVFDPRRLCHAPQERLFYDGEWHQGLVPTDALSIAERDEMARFLDIEEALTVRRGADGRPAFQIPLDMSSRDPDLLALDRLSMEAWLDREGFRTPFLRWYVRYAMLDDFGGAPEDVSAWAGLHYFAARKLRTPELEGSHFLVWPEGNGRLVKALIERARPRIMLGSLAMAVHDLPQGGVAVDYLDVARHEVRRIEARAAVLATPAFVTRRLFPAAAPMLPVRTSSPWLVANLHVEDRFEPNLPWDSILYEAEGLGYVDAAHQLTDLAATTVPASALRAPRRQTVLTYYRAFGGADTTAARSMLLGSAWEGLADGVLRDLAPAHPHLREVLGRMDLMLWGHAMPRPRPGFLGERPFETTCALGPRIAWAHVDQPGMALFEEAQARGVRAAELLAGDMGVVLGESWL
ncbi:FAD-dependent oxidoreductase [Chondromyces apiculatus]|uniref:Amine oxidase domain-containing protein n=1 Tax=Chondromyces apiculatus DSM 436 TaxID=1192034 RepID=A0A017T711_9BACT|nr:FAD-dependent oxidoreductase [Chondromyces apiculatus]EYF04812.1 Hypothetical protein CAP_3838 [Chondromyces apiculatus DSM 436]